VFRFLEKTQERFTGLHAVRRSSSTIRSHTLAGRLGDELNERLWPEHAETQNSNANTSDQPGAVNGSPLSSGPRASRNGAAVFAHVSAVG